MDSSHVEIAIVDNEGGELSFSMSTWKLLLQNGADILKKLRDNATSPQTHIEIDHSRACTMINSSKSPIIALSYT